MTLSLVETKEGREHELSSKAPDPDICHARPDAIHLLKNIAVARPSPLVDFSTDLLSTGRQEPPTNQLIQSLHPTEIPTITLLTSYV